MFKIADRLVKAVSPSRLDPIGLGQTYWKFWRSVMKNPGDLMARNVQLASDQLRLLNYGVKKAAGMDPAEVIAPGKGDRRFTNPAWSEAIVFDLFKQSYLLASSYLMGLAGSAGLDQQSQRKLEFFTRQMVDALSPANFAISNPEVLKATAESGGANLVMGMKNLAGDLVKGKGQLKISMVDESRFEIGENIATTPGKVVYENEMMQLLQYTPTTETVYKRPLVIFPPYDFGTVKPRRYRPGC